MAKEFKLYNMSISELLCKKELTCVMLKCNALWSINRRSWVEVEKPALVWDNYCFATDGDKWYFNRPFYREGTPTNGMTAYASQIELSLDKCGITYEKLTELITSEISIIKNKNMME
jgi:hypothetical protein